MGQVCKIKIRIYTNNTVTICYKCSTLHINLCLISVLYFNYYLNIRMHFVHHSLVK